MVRNCNNCIKDRNNLMCTSPRRTKHSDVAYWIQKHRPKSKPHFSISITMVRICNTCIKDRNNLICTSPRRTKQLTWHIGYKNKRLWSFEYRWTNNNNEDRKDKNNTPHQNTRRILKSSPLHSPPNKNSLLHVIYSVKTYRPDITVMVDWA